MRINVLIDGMKKFARINTCKVSVDDVFKALESMDIPIALEAVADSDDCIILDKDFDFMFSIPPSLFATISQSDLIRNGWISIQDKVSMIGPLQLASLIEENEDPVILEASANNGMIILFLK